MSGPQVFFCGENGDVIHWDIHDPPIKMGPSAVDMFGHTGAGDDRENVGHAGTCGCKLGPTGMTEPHEYAAYRAFWRDHRCPQSVSTTAAGCAPAQPMFALDEQIEVTDPEYARGYQNALKDVLNEVMRSGKQHLVQWIEQQLKALP